MTVKELIEKLKEVPEDYEAIIYYSGECFNVSKIELNNADKTVEII